MSAPTAIELLEFERAHPGHSGRKQQAVRLTFQLPYARYLQLLRVALLTTDSTEHLAALAYDAVFTHHLADRWRAAIAARLRLTRFPGRNHRG